MESTMYQDYAKLKAKIKELEGKAKQLEIDLINDLSDMQGNKLETAFATFSLYSKPKWKYSDELNITEEQIKAKLKAMKKAEEGNGTALKISDGFILKCQLKKD
jgi:hypothetical protein